MQDLKALEGKSLVELREIAKAIGIGDTTIEEARTDLRKSPGSPLPEAPPQKISSRRKKETPAPETQDGSRN